MISKLYKNKDIVYSCEVFPPKKDDEFNKIFACLDSLGELGLDFISVTYGAGGSNAVKNVDIASYIKNKLNIEALAHMTCVGFKKEQLISGIKALEDAGVTSVLALRGDRPKAMTDEEFNSREFEYASDMIKFIKSISSMETAGACYPEKHFEAISTKADIDALKIKVESGCDFLISQLFLDNDRFYELLEKTEKLGIDVPISAGIMPITSAKQLGTTVSLSGTSIPKLFSDIVAKYSENPEDMYKAGVDYAIRQALDLKAHGVRGIHGYVMNKPTLAKDFMGAVMA
ncbi:MAG: methylenetetrahydrofolate reductase [Lachnospiraceae bacterium]|nr:methylenetetrahydrofolate reductase [Lachnospiraceae bacterium]